MGFSTKQFALCKYEFFQPRLGDTDWALYIDNALYAWLIHCIFMCPSEENYSQVDFNPQAINRHYLCYNLGEGNGTPLQYSCLENPRDGGAWWATVHGAAKSRTRLSDFTFPFHFHALEKEMATHSSVLAWRIPGMVEPCPPEGYLPHPGDGACVSNASCIGRWILLLLASPGKPQNWNYI